MVNERKFRFNEICDENNENDFCTHCYSTNENNDRMKLGKKTSLLAVRPTLIIYAQCCERKKKRSKGHAVSSSATEITEN